MCGRFVMIPLSEITRIIADVKRNLKAQKTANVSATYQDVYPKADVPIIVPDKSRLEAQVMQWGYPVTWQKTPVFNTKIETALGPKANMWTDSIQHRRCVVPSYGFYEPHFKDTHPSPKTGKPLKDQYYFDMPDSSIVMMAGVYEDGHFSIVTTAPNQWMEGIHPRMPLVLLPDELDIWLYGDYPTLADRRGVPLESKKLVA